MLYLSLKNLKICLNFEDSGFCNLKLLGQQMGAQSQLVALVVSWAGLKVFMVLPNIFVCTIKWKYRMYYCINTLLNISIIRAWSFAKIQLLTYYLHKYKYSVKCMYSKVHSPRWLFDTFLFQIIALKHKLKDTKY